MNSRLTNFCAPLRLAVTVVALSISVKALPQEQNEIQNAPPSEQRPSQTNGDFVLTDVGRSEDFTTFFRCVEGDAIGCVASSPEQMKQCESLRGSCDRWEQQLVRFSVHVDEFSYDGQNTHPRASDFVESVAGELYPTHMNGDSNGKDATVREIYANPQLYGWTQADPEKDLSETFIFYPEIAGVVVRDEREKVDSATEGQLGYIDVMYPSDRFSGHLRVLSADKIDPHSEPKILIPLANHDVE